MLLDKIKTYAKQLNLKSYVLIYIILYTIMPLINVMTSKFLTTYFYMAVVVISVLYSFYACRLKNIKEYVLLLLPFVIFQLLSLISKGSENFLLAGYQALLFIMPVCIGYIFFIGRDRLYSFFAVLTAVGFTVTAITTIIGCIYYPEAARTLATTATSQDSTALFYNWRNIGGYTFVYSLTLLYPCAILAYKMKKLPLAVAVGFAILALALSIYAEYTYAMMLVLVSTLLFFVKSNISLKKFLILMLVFIAAVILFRETVAAILTKLGHFLGNDDMMEKLNVLFLGKDSVEGFDDNRDQLYLMSFRTFLNHPFFGTFLEGGYGIGGHSFILDNLATFGLLGGVLMFLMYRGIYQVFFRPFSKKEGFGFVFWIFIQPIILSAVNTGMWINIFCFFVPMMLCAIYGKDAREDSQRHDAFWSRTVTPLQNKENEL